MPQERKRLRERAVLRNDSPEGGAATESAPPPLFPPGPLTHSILNEKLIRDFCELILEGLPADSVCNYLGIMPCVYWHWMRKGQLYLDGGESPPEMQVYGQFVRAFRQATARYLRGISKRMHKKKNGAWFRDMEILSRRDRKTWSRDEPAGGTEEQFQPDERFL